jgi:S1-C subfamily serine protease
MSQSEASQLLRRIRSEGSLSERLPLIEGLSPFRKTESSHSEEGLSDILTPPDGVSPCRKMTEMTEMTQSTSVSSADRHRDTALSDSALSDVSDHLTTSDELSLARKVPTNAAVQQKEQRSGITYGAVIHFTTHVVKPNVLKPWKAHDPTQSTGTGFCISNRQIVTNNHVVDFSSSIRVERHGKPGNFEARLLCKSSLCDLALLTVDDDAFWEDVPHVSLQDHLPMLDDTVIAVGYPLGAKSVTVTRGVVSNVALADLSLTEVNPKQLQVQIDAAINPGNSGGPVFNADTGKVVGVAFAGKANTQGNGFIIAVPVLKLFLTTYERTRNPNWGLLPELGITTESLENPIMRKHCFGGDMPEHREGCLITAVDKHSVADGNLQVGDILLQIDGMAVSEKGDVVYRGDEWVHWHYLVTRKPVGDTVEVVTLRQDEARGCMIERRLKMELKPVMRLMPRVMGVDYFPSYVILGGLVILPAGFPLAVANLEQSGGTVNPLYIALDTLMRSGQLNEVDEQVCVLGAVLPHRSNVSYERMTGKIVSKVNGVEVKNMRHLVSLISKIDSGLIIVDFKSQPEDRCRSHVVFDVGSMRSSESEILTLNKIAQWCSPELMPSDAPMRTTPTTYGM